MTRDAERDERRVLNSLGSRPMPAETVAHLVGFTLAYTQRLLRRMRATGRVRYVAHIGWRVDS